MFISFFQVRQSHKLTSAQPTLTIHHKKYSRIFTALHLYFYNTVHLHSERRVENVGKKDWNLLSKSNGASF